MKAHINENHKVLRNKTMNTFFDLLVLNFILKYELKCNHFYVQRATGVGKMSRLTPLFIPAPG